MNPLPVIPSRVLTTSRLKAYRRCAREEKFAYRLGIRPIVEAEATRFGTLIHRALEAWWKASEDRLKAALDVLDAALAAGADPFEIARARPLVKGYHARWNDEPYDVLAVEVEFRAPLTNPKTGAHSKTWTLAGKIDAIVRDRRDGRVLIREFKTTSEDISSGSDYWKRLRLDAQIGMYLVGAKSLGFDVTGCLYDVMAKPSLRVLKATPPESRKFTREGPLYAGQRERDETPEEHEERVFAEILFSPERYFSRGEVVRLDAEMNEYASDLWDLARTMRESELAGRAVRNPDACERYGRMCSYWSVCSGEASIDDPTRFRRLENIHPELGSCSA